MRSLLLALMSSALFLIILSLNIKAIRQYRQAGQVDLAKRYIGMSTIAAMMMVVIPWLRLL